VRPLRTILSCGHEPALRARTRSHRLDPSVPLPRLRRAARRRRPGHLRYVRNYWLCRGFDPPRDPSYVRALGDVGTTQRFYVESPALGGRRQAVDVYLPPGYAAHPEERYPVFYLLHGFPGRPGAFLQTVRMGVVEDILLAKQRIKPMILVMPFGSSGTFTDKEWANGVRPHERWETFVAQDVVGAVDARYRTVRSGAGRILGGLSEGGYASLNIDRTTEARLAGREWSGVVLAVAGLALLGASLAGHAGGGHRASAGAVAA
jgi:hypothetical protein